ncbi:peptide methionine sulfoxide reductase MsrA [Sulfolobales archaeon HS-7]|nr:peptide methionine sulfoxide reductase MsrA [Sulfolobales archaeon HS-7]
MEEIAILGGGCFWCMEAVFSRVVGVLSVTPGYAGGDFPNPTYEDVCSDVTGHAEVVKLAFDNSVISYEDILDIFFDVHDPTTPNRQGNDVGSQYRSIIIYTSEQQRNIALSKINDVERKLGKKVVTEVVPYKEFYEAEDYHHKYFEKHPNQPYCKFVISPKVEKFMKHYPQKVRITG